MSEKKFREILAYSARSGSDPYLVLKKAGLLWDESILRKARTDTLRAAAQAIRERSVMTYPRDASRSAGDMRDHLISFLEELADLQEKDNGKKGNSKEQAA